MFLFSILFFKTLFKSSCPINDSNVLGLYFSQNKKHGSKDRKAIASLCFGYYRMGLLSKSLEMEEAMDIAAWIFDLIPATLLPESWQQKLQQTEAALDTVAQKFHWLCMALQCETNPFYRIGVSTLFENHNKNSRIHHKPIKLIKNYGVRRIPDTVSYSRYGSRVILICCQQNGLTIILV
jgi:hypothetical protein